MTIHLLSPGAKLTSCFQIFPQILLDFLWQARGVKDVAQLRGRETAGEFEGAGERRVGVAQQGYASLGAHGPLGVMADGFDESGSGAGAL